MKVCTKLQQELAVKSVKVRETANEVAKLQQELAVQSVFNGIWEREGFKFKITTAIGDRITGEDLVRPNGWSHDFQGKYKGKEAEVTVTRIDPNKCTSHLYLTLKIVGNYTLEETNTGSDGRCGLDKNIKGHVTYKKKE